MLDGYAVRVGDEVQVIDYVWGCEEANDAQAVRLHRVGGGEWHPVEGIETKRGTWLKVRFHQDRCWWIELADVLRARREFLICGALVENPVACGTGTMSTTGTLERESHKPQNGFPVALSWLCEGRSVARGKWGRVFGKDKSQVTRWITLRKEFGLFLRNAPDEEPVVWAPVAEDLLAGDWYILER